MVLNITKEVANMERLSVGALCERYREVFGEDTKARNKQWLIKRIAWKLQANEEGDISERARKLAMEIAQSSDIRTSAPKIRTRPIEATFETATTISTPPADSRLPVAGTVLMKNYKGRSIQVRVLPNSFEYEGEQYKTLTAIARIVTGQKNINGFRFFKLGKADVLTFDPIWEAMTLRDQIRLINMIVKRVDYDGESGRVTITFHPLGDKSQSEYAAKDLSQV